MMGEVCSEERLFRKYERGPGPRGLALGGRGFCIQKRVFAIASALSISIMRKRPAGVQIKKKKKVRGAPLEKKVTVISTLPTPKDGPSQIQGGST